MLRQLHSADYWDLSYAITEVLAEGRRPQQAIEAVLRKIGETIGFDCATFLVVDEIKVALRCTSFWAAREGSFPHFEVVSRMREFSAGQGLPGAAWLARQPVWESDVTASPNFPRASVAQMDGLQTGVAFPAVLGKRVSGVFEFFSRQRERRQPNLMKFFSAISVQTGIFLGHYRITENITQQEAEVRVAAESSRDAVLTINEDSDILFANRAVYDLFGWAPEELVGKKLMLIMPEYLRFVHEQGLRRYIETGKRHLDWDEVLLPGLHKSGHEIPLRLVFGEFWRGGSRVFTGFARRCEDARASGHAGKAAV